MRNPSEGLDDLPAPIESGMMMKYLAASSGWPAPNSSPAKFFVSMVWPEPELPCSTSTGSPVGAPSVT